MTGDSCCVKNAIDLLENRVGGIPDDLKRNTHEFKCENGWFSGVYGVASLGRLSGELSPSVVKYFDAMERYFLRTNFHGRMTEEKDIKMADRFLVMLLRDYGVGKSLNTGVETSYNGS